MRRQFCLRIDRLDFLARNVGEWVEFQPHAVILDYRDGGAQATLETLASIDPGAERRQRPLQRLHLADETAGIGIGEPQFAIRILPAQRLLQRLDRADVAQAERRDQRVAVGQRFLKQPSGIKKDHRDRWVDVSHHLEQRCRFSTEGRDQSETLASDALQGGGDHLRRRGMTKPTIELLRSRQIRRSCRSLRQSWVRNVAHWPALLERRTLYTP